MLVRLTLSRPIVHCGRTTETPYQRKPVDPRLVENSARLTHSIPTFWIRSRERPRLSVDSSVCAVCFAFLQKLLPASGQLDYAEINGVFQHPENKMILVGDFIDRGPQQPEVLRIARAMCEAGRGAPPSGNT